MATSLPDFAVAARAALPALFHIAAAMANDGMHYETVRIASTARLRRPGQAQQRRECDIETETGARQQRHKVLRQPLSAADGGSRPGFEIEAQCVQHLLGMELVAVHQRGHEHADEQ